MTYCTKCGKPTNNGFVCEECVIAGSPWLSAMKIKENDLEEEVAKLKAENAALRERLEKAVELKAKVGDTIYMPWIWDGTSGIAGIIVREIQIVSDGVKYYVTSFTTDDLAFAAHYKFGKFQEDCFGKMVFTTTEDAEARLTELKEEEN